MVNSYSKKTNIRLAKVIKIMMNLTNFYLYIITKICEYAFSNCDNLKKVEIPKNSNLQTIEKYAFMFSNIEEFLFHPV